MNYLLQPFLKAVLLRFLFIITLLVFLYQEMLNMLNQLLKVDLHALSVCFIHEHSLQLMYRLARSSIGSGFLCLYEVSLLQDLTEFILKLFNKAGIFNTSNLAVKPCRRLI